jgi:hypothetical protein
MQRQEIAKVHVSGGEIGVIYFSVVVAVGGKVRTLLAVLCLADSVVGGLRERRVSFLRLRAA